MSKKNKDDNKISKELTSKDYEKLGQLLFSLGQIGITEEARKKIYRMSFFKGVLSGLGGVIGATIVLALLLFILSLLGEVPLIGDISNTIEKTINSR